MTDQDIISRLFGQEINHTSQILGRGDVNRVYLVEHGGTKHVVRLSEDADLSRFEKEAWCSTEAIRNGVPCPKVTDLGVIDQSAYMVLGFIPGKNGPEITDNKEKIWQTIGQYAKAIHQIPTSGFGEDMTSPGTFSGTWQGYVDYNINSLGPNDQLLSLGTINREQSIILKDKFIKLKNLDFKFGIVHGDLSLANVIVDGDTVTLIDWGCAESTIVPHMELVDLFYNQTFNHDLLLDDFLRGYGISEKEFNSIKPEIDLLTLLQAVDKLRWAIDKMPPKINEFSQRVKSVMAEQKF